MVPVKKYYMKIVTSEKTSDGKSQYFCLELKLVFLYEFK